MTEDRTDREDEARLGLWPITSPPPPNKTTERPYSSTKLTREHWVQRITFAAETDAALWRAVASALTP